MHSCASTELFEFGFVRSKEIWRLDGADPILLAVLPFMSNLRVLELDDLAAEVALALPTSVEHLVIVSASADLLEIAPVYLNRIRLLYIFLAAHPRRLKSITVRLQYDPCPIRPDGYGRRNFNSNALSLLDIQAIEQHPIWKLAKENGVAYESTTTDLNERVLSRISSED